MGSSSLVGFAAAALLLQGGCSSAPVERQEYAELKQERTYEYEFDATWKGIEAALKDHKIVKRSPKKVDEVELKRLDRRNLETDWIISQSKDKFVEYKVNGFPRKKYLQVRFRYMIVANRVMGGTNVRVDLDEEVLRLKEDGSEDGWQDVDQVDTSRANALLERIHNAILSRS